VRVYVDVEARWNADLVPPNRFLRGVPSDPYDLVIDESEGTIIHLSKDSKSFTPAVGSPYKA
jgi:hypothetical protein